MLQYATDYKMVAAGNDSNGTILYQKVGVTRAFLARPKAAFSYSSPPTVIPRKEQRTAPRFLPLKRTF